MSNDTDDNTLTQVGQSDNPRIPSQEGPWDTSNWDDRKFATPNGRVIIETDQTKPDGKIIAE